MKKSKCRILSGFVGSSLILSSFGEEPKVTDQKGKLENALAAVEAAEKNLAQAQAALDAELKKAGSGQVPKPPVKNGTGTTSGDQKVVPPVKQVKPPVQPKKPADERFKAPDNVAKAPDNAVKTESGLQTLVLKKGSGKEKPTEKDSVKVHFTGWKAADGTMFDSSLKYNRPADFVLKKVFKGLTEGLQLMVIGEKRRMWIPADLAFGDKGNLAGDLTIDVELLEINKPPATPKNLTAPQEAESTESGLKSVVLKKGEGDASPSKFSEVSFHFTGWKADGEFWQTSKEGNRPLPKLALDRVIVKGWKEGLQLMKKGEVRRFWIPKELTFGDKPPRGFPEGDIICDLELVDFRERPKPPEAPADVAAPPADAIKLDSGLAYKVVKKGAGTKKPGPKDRVEVHYTGWMTDGTMFDSSIPREKLFTVNMSGGVIKGWLEGLKVMVEGEKTRFWIPAEMAYGDQPSRPGAPYGMLVFDIELVKIISPKPQRKRIEAVTPPIQINPRPKPNATNPEKSGGVEKKDPVQKEQGDDGNQPAKPAQPAPSEKSTGSVKSLPEQPVERSVSSE